MRLFSEADERTYQQAILMKTADDQPFDPFRADPYYCIEGSEVKPVYFWPLIKKIEGEMVRIVDCVNPSFKVDKRSYKVSDLHSSRNSAEQTLGHS